MMKVYSLVLFMAISGQSLKTDLLIKKYKQSPLEFFLTNNDEVTFATSTTFHNYDFMFDIANPKQVRDYKKGQQQKECKVRGCVYVIIDDHSNLRTTVESLLNENNLQVDGKYLLIVNKSLEKHEMMNCFDLLWKYDLYNVVIETNNSFYSWYPYEKCGEVVVHPVHLSGGFSNKIPKKLNCPLRINWSKSSIIVKDPFNETDPGIFILYANVLAKIMGASFVYLKDQKDITEILLIDKSFNIGEEMKKEKTILAIGAFGFYSENETTDQTTYVAPLDTFLILPQRKIKPKWTTFFQFSHLTMSLIAITVFLSGLLIYLFTRKSLAHSLLLSFQTLVQLTNPERPKKLHERIFLISMLFFALSINGFYLSMLSGTFTRPNYEPEIKNLEDFAETDIPLKGFVQFIEEIILANDTNIRNKIKKKLIDTKERGLEQLLYFLEKNDHAIVSTPLHFHYVRNPESLGKIHLMSIYYLFLLPKRCHLKEKIDRHIREIEEAGLRQKFEFMSSMFLTKHVLKENDAIVRLTIDDLFGIFLLWVFGCALSIVVFLAELSRKAIIEWCQ